MTHFTRDIIVRKLEELGRRLDAGGERADVYVVGGAAMVLAYSRDRVTRDIDAVFIPKARVYEVAAEMAKQDVLLGANWLNDAVKGFLPNVADAGAQVLLDKPGIRVMVASAERLMAMKVFAARVDRDRDDILTLCDQVGVTRISQVIELTHNLYGDLLTARSKFVLIELLQDRMPE